MSEDSGFIGNKPQKKEREYVPDFCGSLGKGMLANEALRNAPGLTPLSFDPDIEKIETMRNAPGLSPLHLDNELQKSPQRTLRTQSPILTNFAVFVPFAVRVTKEREMNDR